MRHSSVMIIQEKALKNMLNGIRTIYMLLKQLSIFR